ncbi:unnamed protein product [Agarophyton chilense]
MPCIRHFNFLPTSPLHMILTMYIHLVVATLMLSLSEAQQPEAVGQGSILLQPLPPAKRPDTLGVAEECAAISIRTLSGRCTSAVNPAFGEARRPQYSYFNVCTAVPHGARLPSPRHISNIVSNQDGDTVNSMRLNEMFTFFGQFIDHDFALSPLDGNSNGKFYIEVPEDDPVLSVPELHFIRSERGFVEEGSSIQRPITILSSALDLSTVYGVDVMRNQFLRIVYQEWLPAVLGTIPLRTYTGYDPNVDATVSIEFTTAGFRLGHTLVGTDVTRIGSNRRVLKPLPAERMFFLPSKFFTDHEMEDFIRGASLTFAQELDEKVVSILRNFLFDNVAEEEGFDLLSLNLQRSRDHNVASFNKLRTFFLGTPVASFDEISSNPTTARNLQKAYGDVNEVEAWIGLMAEDKVPGSVVGPTLGALLKAEFERLRDGDQFFYLLRNQIPNLVFEKIPSIESDIFGASSLFNRILVRTTSVTTAFLKDTANAFCVDGKCG